jgi:Ca-activated chloride channel homolog
MKRDTTNELHDRGDDPRLTAYALDELGPEERTALERELAADPVLADEVQALTELSTSLRSALAEPAAPRLDRSRRDEVLRAAGLPPEFKSPRKMNRLAVAAGVFALVGAGTGAFLLSFSSFRRSVGLEGHGYIGPGAGFSSGPRWLEALSDLVSREESAAVPASESFGYGGTTGSPTYDAATPPLPPGASAFNGGAEGPYTLTRDSRLEGAGTETYDPIAESGFRDPQREPLSTFSIDVDTASYANVRRFLNERRFPPPDAVRIEELVNYFRYDYPEPRGAVPFSVQVDSASAPWKPEHRLVRIGLRGRAPEAAAPKVKNLVFLVDVSGSMDDPRKLPLVQRSLRLLVDELAPEDRVALVVYAGNSGVVLPSTSVDERARILDAIEGLRAGGSTNGGSGIQLAYDMAQKHLARDGVNRVILATDGDFNVGITDRGELLRLIEDEAKSGVFLSVLGFGTGNLKDATMEQLADHGNGNYAYVDSLAEARKVLVREMGATLETIAKDVKIQVEFNPAHVAAWRLVGYENRVLAARDFADDTKDAGEIGAGHTVTALYEIVPAGVALASVDALRYQTPDPRTAPRAESTSSELLTVQLRYKQPRADTSELLAVPFTDGGQGFEQAAPDLRFAASVAAFGLCLRASPQRGSATLGDVREWAERALGRDEHGDRREFLRLVDLAAGLSNR